MVKVDNPAVGGPSTDLRTQLELTEKDEDPMPSHQPRQSHASDLANPRRHIRLVPRRQTPRRPKKHSDVVHPAQDTS